ncbi:5-azacytidine resistance protein azr1 [Lophium mytilinum]|uniref:Protein phosphatase n=1 Tax=Lophium mytilinum TaxID=390894 RepID=A0A6A6R4K8_9PEZI|nr:5-azacytidine resistance protein azr1 [Lophium mytilinum]
MGFAAPGALGLSESLAYRASSRLARSPGLLLLCLSTSSLLAAASATRAYNPHVWGTSPAPTCPANRPFSSTCHASNTAPTYTYRIAASYSAKGHRLAPDTNLFTQKPFEAHKSALTDLKECKRQTDASRPRPRSGQDAFFVSQVGATSSTVFGVADGVGGWAESGVDPADFAHGLCDYMACAARMHPAAAAKPGPLRPRDLLQVGFDEVMADKSILGGGSTASVALGAADGSVEVANLGDSGFMHLSLHAVKHVSRPQTHAFNTPYQLSKTPERMLVQMSVFGSSPLADLPKDANVTSHRVRHGDVLIFATDGVWDNLSSQDALGVVSKCMLELGAWVEKGDQELGVSEDLAALTQADKASQKANAKSLQAKLALAITKEAKETSLNTRRDGPFAKEVQKYYPEEKWHGGKPDDIAAVVAVVVENSTA